MHFRTLGVSILALGLAACGGQDEPAPAAPTPAPEEVVEAPSNPQNMSWEGAALVGALSATDQVTVTPGSSVVTLVNTNIGGMNSGGETSGASIEYTGPTLGSLDGQTVTVSFSARAAGGQANRVAVAYSTNAAGNSGWERFDLTSDFAEYSFDYTIPDIVDPASDFIGFWPAGDTVVELESVSVTVPE